MPFDFTRNDVVIDSISEHESDFALWSLGLAYPLDYNFTGNPEIDFYPISVRLPEDVTSFVHTTDEGCCCISCLAREDGHSDTLTPELLLLKFSTQEGGGGTGQEGGPVNMTGDIAGDATTTASLAIGASTTSTIDVAEDRDWFAVELVAGQRYEFKLEGGSAPGQLFDPLLRLMDANGDLVVENDDSGGSLNSTILYTAQTSGTFYLNAGSFQNQNRDNTGTYSLSAATTDPITSRTVDEIANFLTNEFWAQRSWSDTSIDFNIEALTAPQQALALAALEAWADITPITFTRVTTGGQMTFTNNSDDSDPEDPDQPTAFATSTVSNGVITSSTINISSNWNSGITDLDSYTYQTYLHEIGHALGLGHGGPYNGDATYGIDNTYTNDSWAFTVMSYFDQAESSLGSYRFVLGPQQADINAIQDLYGTNPNGTRAGDTTYGFNSTEDDINDWSQFVLVQSGITYKRPPSMTIIDTGGIDTIDTTGFDADQRLDLNAGTFSDLGDRGSSTRTVYENVIAINEGTVIENAITGSGNDTVTGNSANNTITLGAGNDIYVYGTNGGSDTINDFTLGSDKVDLTAFSRADAVAAINSATSSQGGALLTFAAGQTLLLKGVSPGALSASNFNLASPNTIPATEQQDNLIGTAGNDIINALGGDDTITGAAGADTIDGGAGFDTARYADATSGVIIRLWNGTGEGSVAQGDTLTSIESVIGGNFNDILIGSSVRNTLTGLDGADTLFGLAGNDLLRGGLGADNMNGGDGSDTASYSDATTGVTVRLYNGTGEGGIAQGDQLTSIENLQGGNFNDSLIGSSAANILVGANGNDYLAGLSGNDVLIGGSGADVIDGGANVDTASYEGATGGVTVRLFNGTGQGNIAQGDQLQNIENLVGGDFNDSLIGSSDVNALTGGSGNDYIAGLGGRDLLIGGIGSDILDGGADSDTASYADATGSVTIRLYNGTGQGNLAQGDRLISVENVVGGASNDSLIGSNVTNILDGGNGSDFIAGLGGTDILRGGAGADIMDGGAGLDTASYSDATGGIIVRLYNGTGQGNVAQGDQLISIEHLKGSGFNDSLIGSSIDNILAGGNGNDYIAGLSGNDILRGENGADILVGGSGRDTFVFKSGNDTVKDFTFAQNDLIDVSAFANINSLSDLQAIYSQNGSDGVFTFASGKTLTVENVTFAQFSQNDFVFANSSAEPVSTDKKIPTSEVKDTPVSEFMIQSDQFDFTALTSEGADRRVDDMIANPVLLQAQNTSFPTLLHNDIENVSIDIDVAELVFLDADFDDWFAA